MRVLIQRVKRGKITVSNRIIGEIAKGVVIFLGIAHSDTEKEIDFLVKKISNLRIFSARGRSAFGGEDEAGKMKLSLIDVKGEVLVVSQFTLYADCKKGRRPSFTDAAPPRIAEAMYKKFVQKFKWTGLKVEEGRFGAMMDVSLVNWGPVTIMLDSAELRDRATAHPDI